MIMTNLGNAYIAIHPGEILKDELLARHISQKRFAELIGVSYSMLNEILNGKRPITTDFALLVEAALQVKAYIFVNMQTDYDLQMAGKNIKMTHRLEHIRSVCASLF
jgi:addiction module HigA family antidote